MYSGKTFNHRTGRTKAFNQKGHLQHFDKKEDAEVFASDGLVTEYKGYTISHTGEIFKDGKAVFTAIWLRCSDVEDAKKLIDASIERSIMQQRQRVQYMEMVSSEGDCHNPEEDAERFERWTENEAEKQLHSHE